MSLTSSQRIYAATTPRSVWPAGAGGRNIPRRLTRTQYDASSADLSPLGSISKTDAANFQRWARENWDMPIMTEFLEATPSAELLPLSAGVQSDEVEMGLTYQELSDFGYVLAPPLHASLGVHSHSR